jgi:hypothetical protein
VGIGRPRSRQCAVRYPTTPKRARHQDFHPLFRPNAHPRPAMPHAPANRLKARDAYRGLEAERHAALHGSRSPKLRLPRPAIFLAETGFGLDPALANVFYGAGSGQAAFRQSDIESDLPFPARTIRLFRLNNSVQRRGSKIGTTVIRAGFPNPNCWRATERLPEGLVRRPRLFVCREQGQASAVHSRPAPITLRCRHRRARRRSRRRPAPPQSPAR